MNIFKLLGFKKILFCFFKACLIMAFNIFFLLILIDEFYNLSDFAKINWIRFIYFSLFYSILFYLFCFYLRKELNNLENLPKLKHLKKKKKFLEEFKNNYKELNKKDNIKKNILIREKVIYSDFKAPSFNKQDKILKNKQIEYKEKIPTQKKEKIIKKVIIPQKKEKKISKIKLASKVFLVLFLTAIYLGVIVLYPGTYLFLFFILIFYSFSGTIGKILTISFTILVFSLPYILFFADEDMKKDFCDIWIDEE